MKKNQNIIIYIIFEIDRNDRSLIFSHQLTKNFI